MEGVEDSATKAPKDEISDEGNVVEVEKDGKEATSIEHGS
jgi:hypothetical protein